MRSCRRPTVVALLLALVTALVPTVLVAPTGSAAVRKDGAVQAKIVRQLAGFHELRYLGLRPKGRGATIISFGVRYQADAVGVFRSQIDKDVYRVDLVFQSLHSHYLAVIERQGGGYRLRYWGQQWDSAAGLCKVRKPGTAVIHELGLDPVTRLAAGRRCTHPRDIGALQRPMTAGQIAHLRHRYEPRWNGSEWVSRDRPEFTEVTRSCDWDGDERYSYAPVGVVSRANPRFGVLHVNCVTGSVDGVAALNPTHLLVKRPGRTGNFTRMVAHVVPGWSPLAGACATRKRWPLDPEVRAGLRFCTPFTPEIRDFLGRSSL